ncbi:MAG: VapC toxin family PIN domain ribonuclease, partial [Acidobacteriota bacterium]
MIALDTNILVYARRSEAPYHAPALALLTELAQGDAPWALPWPCVYEFLRIITHPRVFDPPTAIDAALEDLISLLESPTLLLLGEGPAHMEHLRRSVAEGRTAGNL